MPSGRRLPGRVQASQRPDTDGAGKASDIIRARSVEEPLRQIVQNAASVAGLLLTTDAMIAEPQKDESDRVQPAPLDSRKGPCLPCPTRCIAAH